MTQTRWSVDGPDESGIELGGRKFSSNDEGAPMMCNLVCSSMGRHVHVDYCRAEENTPCEGAEVQHINSRMTPNPDKPKDAVTHSLHWRRMGKFHPRTHVFFLFEYLLQASKVTNVYILLQLQTEAFYSDPYTRDEQTSFAKWWV
jgi:hypothetical protein